MNKIEGMWAKLGNFTFEFSRGEWDRMVHLFESTGLELVQLSGELLDELIEDPAKIPARVQHLTDHGLSIAALGAYCNMVSPNLEKRRRNITFLKNCLRAANQLGTTVVSTETGTLHPSGDWSDTPENATPAAWDELYRVLDELLPVAESAQSVLALEGYVNNILKTYDQAEQILRRYPSPHLKLMCDPYNYLSQDLLPQSAPLSAGFLQRFKDDFAIAHLKDVSSEGAEVDTPEFGTGIFPQGLYVDFLKAERPDLPVIFEHLPFEHIPVAIQRLQAIHTRRS